MSKEIYGMTTVHPENVIQPNWTDALPDKSGGSVRFFDTIIGVTQAVNDCSQGNWYFNTQFGPGQDERLTIGSVGIVYKIAVSDELMEYINDNKQKTANSAYLFTSQLPKDAILETIAILPEDVLHTSQIVELTDAPKLLKQRKEHMKMLDEILKISKPHHRANFDTKDSRHLTSVRMTYGNKGFITNPASHEEIAQFVLVMKNILESSHANLDYVLAMPYFSHMYKTEVMKTSTTNQKLLHLLATKELLNHVAAVADKNGDFKMRSMLFSMQNQVNKEIHSLEPPKPADAESFAF